MLLLFIKLNQYMKPEIEKLVPFILKWEGKYSDLDGTPTMMGVTLPTYTYYKKLKKEKEPTVNDLRGLSMEEWTDILRTLFWDRWRASDILDGPVCYLLVDWLWNSGNRAIKIPQGLLGVSPDGIVGNKTISALNSRGPQFFDDLYTAREEYLRSIATGSRAKFLRGWLNRIESLRDTFRAG